MLLSRGASGCCFEIEEILCNFGRFFFGTVILVLTALQVALGAAQVVGSF